MDPYWTLIGPWPSGAGGEVSGAGPGTLGTPGPMEPGTLKGPQVQRHWLRRKGHLAMAWRRRRQRAALARPKALARQHLFGRDGCLIIINSLIYHV